MYATGGRLELMDACVVDMASRVVTPRATRAGTYSEKRRKKRRSNYFKNPVSNPNFKRGGMKGLAGRRRGGGRFFKYSAEDGGRARPRLLFSHYLAPSSIFPANATLVRGKGGEEASGK